MQGMGLDYALNCVLRICEIFSRGREPEIEGDHSRPRERFILKSGAEDGGSQ